MSGRRSLLAATAISFFGLLSGTCEAATFDIDGTLNLNGQIIEIGPSATLNFAINGPIANPFDIGYSLSVSLSGAPTTTSTTTNIVPFIGATAFADVNGASTTVNTSNCFTGCGLLHPISGNAFMISNADRNLSISLVANFLTIGAVGNLPADDVITLAYNLNLGLPQGLSAEMVTPLPGSAVLFATGIGLVAWGSSRRKRLFHTPARVKPA